MLLVKAPDDTSTPATISPTYPLETIPIPTPIDLDLSLRKRRDGSPHPINLVTTAIAIINPANNRTVKLIPLRST